MGWDIAVVLLQEDVSLDLREWMEAGQLLSLLREEGFTASGHLIRSQRQRSILRTQLERKQPGLIFLQTGKGQSASALAFLNEIGAAKSKSKIVIGGSFGTLCSHEFTAHRMVDGVILGEFHEAILELAISRRDNTPGEEVKGLWWKSPHGWKLTPRRFYHPNLEKWPAPCLEDFHYEDVVKLLGNEGALCASRGFPFLSVVSGAPHLRHLQETPSYYYPSPAYRVIEEAKHLKKRYKVSSFRFCDEIFPWDDDWIAQFCQLWKAQVDLPFTIPAAAEHLPEPRLNLLRRAGLKRVELTLEGADEGLRGRCTDLNATNARIKETLRLCEAMKVECQIRIVLGVPGETSESLREAVPLAESLAGAILKPEIHTPWPASQTWLETERSITGSDRHRPVYREAATIGRSVVVTHNEIAKMESVRRSKLRQRDPRVTLDSLADFEEGSLKSPLESAVRVTRFHSGDGSKDVLALRVPTEIAWSVRIPKNPILKFSMLLEPALPGERTRQPISFSIKIRQKGRAWRLFQKVVIQALDPDSRRWHHFKIPVSGAGLGEAEVVLENLVFGGDATSLPEGHDIWAGWADVLLTSELSPAEAEGTDEELL